MPTGPEQERRKEPRLIAAHPVSFEWQTREGELHRARGVTRDISLGGLYCQLERALPANQFVEFDVVLPAELAQGEPVRIHCNGRVVRCEKTDLGYGVAVRIEASRALERVERTGDAARHRLHTRIVPPTLIVAEYPGMRSLVRDLSEVGAFIEDERPLPVARVFDLHLTGEKLYEEIQVRAIVRRVEPHVGMAVEFVALSPEAKKRLRELTQQGQVWESTRATFPSPVWQPGEGTATLEQTREFLSERARRALPQLEVLGCFYRVMDRRFSLHLREPVSQAELLLPLSEQWVQDCRTGDCSRLDRAIESAARILDLGPQPARKPS